jgi:hypothetical protein
VLEYEDDQAALYRRVVKNADKAKRAESNVDAKPKDEKPVVNEEPAKKDAAK